MSDKDTITYDEDTLGVRLPAPDFNTELWHRIAQMVYMFLAVGPWQDLRANTSASLKAAPHNSEIVFIAELLAVVQEMIVEEYRAEGKMDNLEQLKNYFAETGPLGAIEWFLIQSVQENGGVE